MGLLTGDLLKCLMKPGPRQPWVVDWLLSSVWSPKRFGSVPPENYLAEGEKLVHELEELLSAAAQRFSDELAAAAVQTKPLFDGLPDHQTAVIVFDGASLREIPLFLKLAEQSGFRVIESSVSHAAVPSKTTDFVEQRLIGKPVGPKDLPHRKELKERGIRVWYFDAPIRTNQIHASAGENLLLWSAFPDVTYMDSGARFAKHFAELQPLFETVWKNTVMQVPRGYRIIITSDHGYIFFGAGLESTRSDEVCGLLDQDRAKKFGPDESLPAEHPDLQIFPNRRLAMVRGRIKNRPQGMAGNRVYRHGGLSIMEMLTPWLVLEKE